MAYLSIFRWTLVSKTVVMFGVSTLELAMLQSVAQK